MHIIIPMSGIGKRFIDAGYVVPKPLIIVENKPIIQHIVELFPGESKFTFICNDDHLKNTNMREILEKISPGCSIFEVSVNDRKGPVDAVLQAKDLIIDDEKIIIGKRGTFYWANLEQADVHARYKGAGNNYRNVIILKFKNEEPIYLFNYGYGNISHIRTYITSKINEPMK